MSVITLTKLRTMKREIEEIADRYGVTNVRVFGSVARGDADDNSDIDFLVDRKTKSLLALGGFKMDMEYLLGHKADIVTIAALKNSELRDSILSEAKSL